VITGIKRVSKPGLRRYVRADEIPSVMGGLGVAVLSTPKGVLSDKKAREKRVGGELLCMVW
jgi:small subunit ribosomal protein S8